MDVSYPLKMAICLLNQLKIKAIVRDCINFSFCAFSLFFLMRLQEIFKPVIMILYTKLFLFVSLQVTLSQGFVRSAKENVTITTKLVSTKLTQNVDLMKLLNWKSSQNSISDTLSKIMSLSGEEIVKFLQDILDALFAMFSTGQFLSDKIFLLIF